MIDRKISSYLAMFSHELKSPLNNIINLTKLIELSIQEADEGKLKKYLSLVMSSAFYLKTLINNTIEFGKINHGKSEVYPEEFNIVETLFEMVDLTKIMLGPKPVEVKFNYPLESFYIVSDPVKIKQILLNIASNAAKFTKEGCITFSLFDSGDFVTITVEDTGKGIKDIELNRLFHPFCKLENSHERKCDSTGLGLYITRQLLNMLGGEISIESEYGKGTTVYITIPKNYKE
ncbi:HAMP domain-containing sensor histidine kinase [Thermodesulfovibrio sp. 3907-1M]|uniref:histidine kinase n=1 Tax=Thermodesulfovibrio autotrophicus TaxID=3118333 RepID=A0AAU8GUK9_9BACT